MNLADYLSRKSKVTDPERTDWLSFCALEVRTSALWAGDPYVANAEDGCVVQVPAGNYLVEAIGRSIDRHRDRAVARLRVRLESVHKPEVGEEVGKTGTDHSMIGVCDIGAFNSACREGNAEAVQEEIESQADGEDFGIIELTQFPGAVMPFIPTGSDGSGPVRASWPPVDALAWS